MYQEVYLSDGFSDTTDTTPTDKTYKAPFTLPWPDKGIIKEDLKNMCLKILLSNSGSVKGYENVQDSVIGGEYTTLP